MAFNIAQTNASKIVKAYAKGGMVAVKKVVENTGTTMKLSQARAFQKQQESNKAQRAENAALRAATPKKKTVVAKKKVKAVAKKKVVAKKKAVAKKKVVAKKKSKYSRGAATA